MAAILKKRALAEYTQEEPTTIPQKYRCVVKPQATSTSSSFIFLSLLESSNSNNLQLLLRISEALQFQEKDVPDPSVIKKLTDHFVKEKDSAVRMVILSIFSDIAVLPEIDLEFVKKLINEIMNLLRNESSHKVLNQGLSTLLRLGKLQPESSSSRFHLIHQAKEHLLDTSPSVKCKCFDIFGELLPTSKGVDNSAISYVLKVLGEYIHDDNARTRCSAFQNMVTLHNRGLKLDPIIYSEVCVALKDDYEDVRTVALKLIWLLGTTYPHNIVRSSNSDEDIALIDDAFGNICNLIVDISVRVRIIAAELLGSMHQVSSAVVLQTLDKSLMADMRKKRSAHERAIENVKSGFYTRGRGWTQDTPKEQLDEDQVSIMKSGAYGAFVHGLEDEYLEVRSASIDSICSLAVSQPNFAMVALDFLVDMFNDDIHEVRLKAIDSLCRMSDHIEFREDQLEMILGLLEDSSLDVREGLQRILTSCKFVTKDCLQICVKTLLNSLKKYPQDKKSIWNSFHKMGYLHATLVLPLVPELLAIHPFFDTPQTNMDDPEYICILLLIFNAAEKCKTIIGLLEEKTIKHYSYLRDTMPHIVPFLPLSNSVTSMEMKSVPTATVRFLEAIFTRFKGMDNTRMLVKLLDVAEKDLSRLSRIDREVAGTAQFTSLFFSSQILCDRLVNNNTWYSNSSIDQLNIIRNSFEKLLHQTIKMQYLFIGLNNEDLAVVKQLKLKVLALLLVFVNKASGANNVSQAAKALCHYFISQVDEVNNFLEYVKIIPEKFTSQLSQELSALDEVVFGSKKMQNLKPETFCRIIIPLFKLIKPICPSSTNMNIRMCNAVINSPVGGPDPIYKFIAGLVMKVQLDAEISHLVSTKLLRLQLKYPDQQIHLIVPRPDHLRRNQFYLNPDHMYRLVTTALISHQVWSDSCFVELSLVLDLTDLERAINHSMSPNSNQLCVINLCEPVKLHVSPTPVKHGV